MENFKISIPITDLSAQYQSVKPDILKAVHEVLESTAYIMGEDVKKFESEIAKYLKVKHAIGLNSGTDALVLGLKALGIGPGDEVITTAMSFFATAGAISLVGATPVFADVEESTFNISPQSVEKLITPRTKVILPVHLYGNPAPMKELLEIAKKNHLFVLEDCAQSLGGKYGQENYTGTLGHAGCFSFFPTKNLGACGDAGLFATNDDKLAETVRMLRVHGAKKKYYNEILGFNSRLDTLQAAILRVKLPHLDKWNEMRRKVAQKYNQLLEGTTSVKTPELFPGHVFHLYTIRVLNGKRDAVQQKLLESGIQTLAYYPVLLNKAKIYESRQHPATPVADQMNDQILSLPFWAEMEESKMRIVVEKLKEAVS